MVVITSTSADTVSVIPHEFPFGDFAETDFDLTTAINEFADGDLGLDWLPSPVEDDNDALACLSRPWTPVNMLPDDDSAPMWSELVLNADLDAWNSRSGTPSSQLSSPTESVAMLFSAASSDTDEIFDGELSRPIKRKSTLYDDDDVQAVKKMRQMKKACKPRAQRDDATIKTIAQLRSESNDPEARRRVHNVLERKRRNDLKESYDELRDAIPEMVSMERAPTGQILAKAVEFIAFLQHEDRHMQDQLAVLRAENERLRRLNAN